MFKVLPLSSTLNPQTEVAHAAPTPHRADRLGNLGVEQDGAYDNMKEVQKEVRRPLDSPWLPLCHTVEAQPY